MASTNVAPPHDLVGNIASFQAAITALQSNVSGPAVQVGGDIGGTAAAPTVVSLHLASPQKTSQYLVASLPTGSEGQIAYATNGCKVGESTGTGTGVPVYFSNAKWRVFSTDAQVAS